MRGKLMLYNPSDFSQNLDKISLQPPSYYYEGICPHRGQLLRLPRTAMIEAIAVGLMQQLPADSEGKMYGVLLVQTPSGEKKVIKAFSGLLRGKREVEGWVSSIPGRESVARLEKHTLAKLETLKQALIRLNNLEEREQYRQLKDEFDLKLQKIKEKHRQNRENRQQQRERLQKTLTDKDLSLALKTLEQQSQREKSERNRLKQHWKAILDPLQQKIKEADQQTQQLKQERKALSRQLQAQLYEAYTLSNFWGESLSLQSLMGENTLPTGTGECCAPKLLHYAAIHQLIPLAMAEFWWGKSSIDRVSGQFYGACKERCQPLMGFLLSGLSEKGKTTQNQNNSLVILYEDADIIAVDKPSGLLSVSGRYFETQESVLTRLRQQFADGMNFKLVHRLDQDTSGIILIARHIEAYRRLAQQFQQRQVHKVYESILAGVLTVDQGVIELPLWGNPAHRPYQQVNWEKGKPSITHFRVLKRDNQTTRVEFIPLTGRTHQLRVHAVDSQGLGIPILGDGLYSAETSLRLHLHARELRIKHPFSEKMLHLRTEVPF